MRKSIAIILSTFFIISCSVTNNVRYYVEFPPLIQLPYHFNKVGILNRSVPTQENTPILNKVDEILSGEGFNLDAKGAYESVSTMQNYLSEADFTKVIKIDSVGVENNLFQNIPSAIEWGKIEAYCIKYDLDGIVSLEYYDTHSEQSHSKTPTTITLPGGKVIHANKYTIVINTEIEAYWRVYDWKTQTILDNRVTRGVVSSKGTGISLLAAYNAMKGRENEVLQKSEILARNHASKMFTRNKRVVTSYYDKGSSSIVQASRSVEVNNWGKAMELWLSESDNTNKKIGGRAMYNLAVGLDVLENPDSALYWTQKAYEDFGDKRAKNLNNKLQKRINLRY